MTVPSLWQIFSMYCRCSRPRIKAAGYGVLHLSLKSVPTSVPSHCYFHASAPTVYRNVAKCVGGKFTFCKVSIYPGPVYNRLLIQNARFLTNSLSSKQEKAKPVASDLPLLIGKRVPRRQKLKDTSDRDEV